MTTRRYNYLTLAQTALLRDWGLAVHDLFRGEIAYQVGSSTERASWRDVDVRLILDDAQHRRLTKVVDIARLNMAVSVWGERATGLPIDFQVQQQTAANSEFPKGFRNPIALPGRGA